MLTEKSSDLLALGQPRNNLQKMCPAGTTQQSCSALSDTGRGRPGGEKNLQAFESEKQGVSPAGVAKLSTSAQVAG